jgi:LysR family transcriptional regulator, glycine cleavage system transcriptional activator
MAIVSLVDVVTRKLPPLNALRAFESSARLGSFAKAAAELHVTPTAISHQIKVLEQYLGCALFQRLPNGLRPTLRGQTLLPHVEAGFDQFEAAVRLIMDDRSTPDVLVISALPSFTQEWLLPRLVDFRQRWPNIDVLLQTEYRMVALESENVDVAIRFGRGDFGRDLQIDLLAHESVTPVCSPSLLGGRSSADRRELDSFTLLNSSVRMVHEPWMSWEPWLKEIGLSGRNVRGEPQFSDPLLILRSAAAGAGFALGRSMLIQDHLVAGRLVRPFPDWIKPILSSYYVVSTKEKAKLHKVTTFRDWLLDIARGTLQENVVTFPIRA